MVLQPDVLGLCDREEAMLFRRDRGERCVLALVHVPARRWDVAIITLRRIRRRKNRAYRGFATPKRNGGAGQRMPVAKITITATPRTMR